MKKEKEKNPFHSKSFQLFNEPKNENGYKLNALNERYLLKKLNTTQILPNETKLKSGRKTAEKFKNSNISGAELKVSFKPLTTNTPSSTLIYTGKDPDQINLHNFYIQKMTEFGFNGLTKDKKILSRSDNNLDKTNEEKFFSGMSTRSVDSSDSETSYTHHIQQQNSNIKPKERKKSGELKTSNKPVKFYSPSLIIRKCSIH
ncbi:unnamed protein product [Brachionus calyciflorus]|uniref:Uncharacterized protein n=1 Tax=Brachionus calyciflorus TaxID=104777 RepID=A0A814JU57_9BILA|nr:unnamed protein product [Brachionus calyciflorus]